MIAEVVLKLPVQEAFDYIVPEAFFENSIRKNLVGYRVIVPFRGDLKTAIVVAIKETSTIPKLILLWCLLILFVLHAMNIIFVVGVRFFFCLYLKN